MKKNSIFLILPIVIIGFIFLFSGSCKKDEKTNEPETMEDIDGNIYKIVTIGTQTWMAENLKVTKYRNGDLIGSTVNAYYDITYENSPKYQWPYAGSESNAAIYGRLYTWYAATDTRNVCPTDWHLPGEAEWITLRDFLGGESAAANKLKETGTTHWIGYNIGNNETGFTALPGGCRVTDSFDNIGNTGNWWTSTTAAESPGQAQFFSLDGGVFLRDYVLPKAYGFSVRCIKD